MADIDLQNLSQLQEAYEMLKDYTGYSVIDQSGELVILDDCAEI